MVRCIFISWSILVANIPACRKTACSKFYSWESHLICRSEHWKFCQWGLHGCGWTMLPELWGQCSGAVCRGVQGCSQTSVSKAASCPAVGNLSGGFKLSSGKQWGTESERERKGEFVWGCVCIWLCNSVYVFECMWVCTWEYIHVKLWVYMYCECMCMWGCECAWMCVCVCLCELMEAQQQGFKQTAYSLTKGEKWLHPNWSHTWLDLGRTVQMI